MFPRVAEGPCPKVLNNHKVFSLSVSGFIQSLLQITGIWIGPSKEQEEVECIEIWRIGGMGNWVGIDSLCCSPSQLQLSSDQCNQCIWPWDFLLRALDLLHASRLNLVLSVICPWHMSLHTKHNHDKNWKWEILPHLSWIMLMQNKMITSLKIEIEWRLNHRQMNRQ